MSKIKKFQFKNVRSYGNKMVDIPFDMDNGLVLISGKNGGGKTSIVEGLEFAIYGNSSRVPVKNLPNWINDNLFTNIEFETDDKRNVQLSRGVSPDFYDLKVGGTAYSSKVKNENRAGKTKIDKMIEDDLYGLAHDIFANNVLLSVQDFKSFVKMKAADKRKIIDKIFDTDIFNDMLVKLKDELTELKKRQAEISYTIESKKSTLDITNARIDEIKSTISDDIDAVISRYQNNILEIECTLNEKLSILSAKQASNDIIQSQYSALMQEFNKSMYDAMVVYNLAITAIDSEFNTAISDYVNSSNKKITDELSSIESDRDLEISALPNFEDSIKQRVDEIQSKIVKISDILEQFKKEGSDNLNNIYNETNENSEVECKKTTEKYNEDYKKIIGDISDIESKISFDESESTKHNLDIQSICGKIAVISNKLDLYKNDKCPECGGDLHDSFHTDTKTSFEVSLENLYKEQNSHKDIKSSIDSNIASNRVILSNLNTSLFELKSIYDKQIYDIKSSNTTRYNDAKNSYTMSLNSMEANANSKIEQFTDEINSIRENAKSEYDVKINEINNEFNKKTNFVRSQYNDAYNLFENSLKNDLLIRKNAKKEEYDKLVYELKESNNDSVQTYTTQIEISKSEIKILSGEIDGLRIKLNDLKINLATVQNGDSTKTITELSLILNSLLGEINAMQPEYDEIKKKITIRENTQALIGENGLKKMIMRNILPQFNASIQRITELFDFKYRFIFDDNFDVHLSYFGKEVPVSVSRGEEKIMDIIVILSTLQLILLKHQNINMLFLDEIFVSLDVENIARAVSILKDYSRKYNLIVFVMSHTQVPVELFDKTINVSSDGTFSSIEII